MKAPKIFRDRNAREYWFEEGCYITEWINDESDPGLSVARARVPPGGTTRWHCLEGIAERYLILEGRGRAEIDGGLAEVLGPGDAVLIPPGTAQRIHNPDPDDLVFLAISTPRFQRRAYRDLEAS